MAIKVDGVTVIDDDRTAKLEVMNPGTPGSLPDSANVGDMLYSQADEKVMVWTGSEWK